MILLLVPLLLQFIIWRSIPFVSILRKSVSLQINFPLSIFLQEIQQRAREEALAILGNEPMDVLPTVGETNQMTYINQIIKEVKKK